MLTNLSLLASLRDGAGQPLMYDVPKAHSEPYRSGNWVGSTQKGGSCNFNTVSITPHCNGTHTECIGHIVHDTISLPQVLTHPFFNSLLISLPIQKANSTQEDYVPQLTQGDTVLTKADLEKAIEPYLWALKSLEVKGLIVRTLPNSPSKMNRNYNEKPAPFFTNAAIRYLNTLNLQHLIVDLPSIDKAYDEGLLSNHHIFWNQPMRDYVLKGEAWRHKTITELIFVPDEIKDGLYETFIGFPNWQEEAVPSSVWIQPIASPPNA